MPCVGLRRNKKNKCTDGSFKSLTKTIAANQQRRRDDTSFILFTAVNSDDSLKREKKTVEEVTYMAKKRERAREEERERSAGYGFYLWFVYLCSSQWFPAPPQPLLKIHTDERDAPNRRKCFSPITST